MKCFKIKEKKHFFFKGIKVVISDDTTMLHLWKIIFSLKRKTKLYTSRILIYSAEFGKNIVQHNTFNSHYGAHAGSFK